jgi:hypothetical protein
MEPVITLSKEHGDGRSSFNSPGELASLATKLSETREQLSTTIGNARLESYTKFCELSNQATLVMKALDALTAEYEKTKWKLKFTASLLSVALAAAGYLGFHYGYGDFYRDVKNSVTQKLQDEIRSGVISEDRSFYNDLVAGNALNAAGQYAHATERLMACFKPGHYYDTAVLLPLLDSIYKNDDWENAKVVLDVLEKGEPQFGSIRDHTILAYIGSIEVQAAGVHADWLENGFSILQRAQLLAPPGDTAALSMIHTNYWIYDIHRQDWKSADAEINALKELDVSVYSWDTVRRWRFFVQYFSQPKNLEFEPLVRRMWSELRHRASDQ